VECGGPGDEGLAQLARKEAGAREMMETEAESQNHRDTSLG
jgi:hypothetical protein